MVFTISSRSHLYDNAGVAYGYALGNQSAAGISINCSILSHREAAIRGENRKIVGTSGNFVTIHNFYVL